MIQASDEKGTREQNVTAVNQFGEYGQLLLFLPVGISAVDGKLL